MKTHYLILSGGLGNQMFQYALYHVLREKGMKVKLDTSLYNLTKMHNGYELDRVFDISDKTICKRGLHLMGLRLLLKYRPKFLVTVDKLFYDASLLNVCKPYIYGYWQDECYFKSVEQGIRSIFSFQGIDNRNLQIANELRACNSISLHIRRGDYVSYGMTIIKEDYYKQAVQYFNNQIKNCVFYIFSDDIKESEDMIRKMNVDYKMIYHNKGTDSYKDMYLMSNCQHNIIANSSFSWWGAWLNNNPDKIIVSPKVWSSKNELLKPQLKEWILV